MRSWRLLDNKPLWGLCDSLGAIWKELQGRKTSLRCFILVKERKKITETASTEKSVFTSSRSRYTWISTVVAVCEEPVHSKSDSAAVLTRIRLLQAFSCKKGQIFLQCGYSHCFREWSFDLSLCVLSWRRAMGRRYGEKVVHEAAIAPTLAKMLKYQYRCQGIWWKVLKLVVILLLTLSNRTVFVMF